MLNKIRIIVPEILFWMTLVAVIIMQLFYLDADAFQIRYEELAEAIRNPYWFSQGLIYDGISSNVGWYGLLHYIYSVIGFDLFTGRYVKTFLYIVSLVCLASLLKKYSRDFLIPVIVLIVVGLSPVNLYYSKIMTTYGIDIYYIIIWFFLIDSIKWKMHLFDCTKMFFSWFVVMIGCMSFPSVISYLPSIGIFYLLKYRDYHAEFSIRKHILFWVFSSLGFVFPLILAWIQIGSGLFYDENTGAGLFMGGGKFASDLNSFQESVLRSYGDIFIRGNSYYFELKYPDFSSRFSWFAILLLFIGSIWTFINFKEQRTNLLLILLLLIISSIIPNLAENAPGIRRMTGVLAALYLLYFVFLSSIFKNSEIKKWVQATVIVIMLFIPLHHLNSYFRNLNDAGNLHHFRNISWFIVEKTPQLSMKHWLVFTKKTKSLPCLEIGKVCRYSEIFGALAGYRLWNNLPDVPVWVIDPGTDKKVRLDTQLWVRNEFQH